MDGVVVEMDAGEGSVLLVCVTAVVLFLLGVKLQSSRKQAPHVCRGMRLSKPQWHVVQPI